MGLIIQDSQDELIFRYAFHGFSYDGETKSIGYNLSLGRNESELLDNTLGREHTYDEYRNVVDKYEKGEMLGVKCDSISLSQLNRGDVVTIKCRYGFKLRLMYSNTNKFLCLSDNSNVLHYGDELLLLSMGIGIGDRGVFCVKRNNKDYPDEQKVYRTPIIHGLFLLLDTNLVEYNKVSLIPIRPAQIVYASCFEKGPNGFYYLSGESLIEDDAFLLKVDLSNKTYSLNLTFCKDYYDKSGINIVDDVLKPISIVKGCDISRIISVREGRLRFIPNRNILKVDCKMSITLGD